VRADATILSTTFGASTGVTATHRYTRAAAYPLVLTVTDNAGATGTDETTVTIGGSTTLVARAGGPYSGSINTPISFNGSGSTVPAGSVGYAWQFGDDIVLHAASFAVTGTSWNRVSDASAADGIALDNPDRAAAKVSTALAAPSSYVEATFRAAAGVPYRMWIRLRAAGNSWSNDSIHVQFSGTTIAAGGAAWRIGTTQSLGVVLEDGAGAGVSGWGWADAGYGVLGDPIYFNQDGLQTIRIQQREDGVRIDQVVISSNAYYDAPPGPLLGDSTIVPVTAVDARSATVQHAYRRAGTYPITLTVTAGSATAADNTTAVIR
jgi:PKD repeat protein